jgi:hypothetical protein
MVSPRRRLAHAVLAAMSLLASVGAVEALPASLARPHIVGGADAPPHGWRDAAAVVVGTDSHGPFYCSGSLIGARWILTARHCVVDASTGLLIPALALSVAVGNQPPVTRTDWLRVVAVYPHDTADVALLKLASASPMPTLDIVMPGQEASWAAGQLGFVVGWGVTQEAPAVAPSVLQEAAITIQPDAACATLLGASFLPEDLCAGSVPNIPATCHGDSGAPLVIADPVDGYPFLVGVANVGSAAGCTSLPSVFTKTDPIRPWIVETAGLGAPVIGERVASPGASTAVVHVSVIGRGSDYFVSAEYGASYAYRTHGVWVHGDESHVVDLKLTGLLAGAETPYRVVAWSSYGTTFSPAGSVYLDDVHPPVVHAYAASGRRRQPVKLVWSITDDSGRGDVDISVYNGKKRIAFSPARPYALGTRATTWYIKYLIPRNAPRLLTWCVQGVDPSGNRSARRCARLTTRA